MQRAQPKFGKLPGVEAGNDARSEERNRRWRSRRQDRAPQGASPGARRSGSRDAAARPGKEGPQQEKAEKAPRGRAGGLAEKPPRHLVVRDPSNRPDGRQNHPARVSRTPLPRYLATIDGHPGCRVVHSALYPESPRIGSDDLLRHG